MKKIVFITGTRADYGKIKSVIKKLNTSNKFEIWIYVTGMHLLDKYGSTHKEIKKDGFKNIFLSNPISNKYTMDEILANNILQMSTFIKKISPDMIFVHGDRVEALAGAIVGSLNNIFVSHIEGGEISGTIDETIRHAVSKLSNFHFVSNESSRKNLIQMGENKDNIFVVGSPDLDIMLKNNFDLEEVKKLYNIKFDSYAIAIYHPVTTEIESLNKNIQEFVKVLKNSKKNYILIFPNNDLGSNIILEKYEKLKNNSNILQFPSIRFEYFLTLLKNAEFVIGNSSLGIRESGIYGIPTVNIGSRQDGRYNLNIQKNIQCVEDNYDDIMNAINRIHNYKVKNNLFGKGNSDEEIFKILNNKELWQQKNQKKFISIW